ncbi:hypothetical protein PPL_00893 [Heterostelium album PN500]|uniref:Uncharacterized protein n=1 Tax=Heterostelium pallidum (strain ATCC 26659 / Pp 5 / PN500) TaxID=670386 RepID=D3AYX4_HETP5|nr:hypothetical protein PPL_00893 [Heterostelium album PN500]EFA85664.1 hypothetical protein PPL_00893 [Heterostelium album PN500]|eukprot:XP_020437771.1 hypothetical protein PPL_00893 [Heterostelium album PN500]
MSASMSKRTHDFDQKSSEDSEVDINNHNNNNNNNNNIVNNKVAPQFTDKELEKDDVKLFKVLTESLKIFGKNDLITKKPKVKLEVIVLKKQKMIDAKIEKQEESSSSRNDEEVFIGPVDSKSEEIIADIRKYLSLAFRKPERSCLIYISEHRYTQVQYSMECLKGQDAHIATTLLQAADGTGNGIEHADSIIFIFNVIGNYTITDAQFCDKLSRCFNILAKLGKQDFFQPNSKTFFKLLEQSMGLEPTFIGRIDQTFTEDSINSNRIKAEPNSNNNNENITFESNNNNNIKLESINNNSIKLESIPATELETIILEAFENCPSEKISDIFETYGQIKSILKNIGNQQQTESLLNTINPLFYSKVAATLNISEWKGFTSRIDFIINFNEITDETKHNFIDKIVGSLCSNCNNYPRYCDLSNNLLSIYQCHLKHLSYFNLSNFIKIIDHSICGLYFYFTGDNTRTQLLEILFSIKNEQLLDKLCAKSTPDKLLLNCQLHLNRLNEPSCTIEEIRLFGKMWCHAILSRFKSAGNVSYHTWNVPIGSYSYPFERNYTCSDYTPQCHCMKVASFLPTETKVIEFKCLLEKLDHIENIFAKYKNFLRYEKRINGPLYQIRVTKLQPSIEYLNSDAQEFIESLTISRSAIPEDAIAKLSNDDYITIYYRALDTRLNELTARQPITPLDLPAIPPFSTTTTNN